MPPTFILLSVGICRGLLIGLCGRCIGRKSLISVRGIVALIEVLIVVALVISLIVSVVLIWREASIVVVAIAESACVCTVDRLVAICKNENGSQETEEDGKNKQKSCILGVEVFEQIIESYVVENRINNAQNSRNKAG